jgi:hypothetical protein
MWGGYSQFTRLLFKHLLTQNAVIYDTDHKQTVGELVRNWHKHAKSMDSVRFSVQTRNSSKAQGAGLFQSIKTKTEKQGSWLLRLP